MLLSATLLFVLATSQVVMKNVASTGTCVTNDHNHGTARWSTDCAGLMNGRAEWEVGGAAHLTQWAEITFPESTSVADVVVHQVGGSRLVADLEVAVVNSEGVEHVAKTGGFAAEQSVHVGLKDVTKVIVRLMTDGQIVDWIRLTEIEVLTALQNVAPFGTCVSNDHYHGTARWSTDCAGLMNGSPEWEVGGAAHFTQFAEVTLPAAVYVNDVIVHQVGGSHLVADLEVAVINSMGQEIVVKTGGFEATQSVSVEEMHVEKVIVRLMAGGQIVDWIRMTEIEVLASVVTENVAPMGSCISNDHNHGTARWSTDCAGLMNGSPEWEVGGAAHFTQYAEITLPVPALVNQVVIHQVVPVADLEIVLIKSSGAEFVAKSGGFAATTDAFVWQTDVEKVRIRLKEGGSLNNNWIRMCEIEVFAVMQNIAPLGTCVTNDHNHGTARWSNDCAGLMNGRPEWEVGGAAHFTQYAEVTLPNSALVSEVVIHQMGGGHLVTDLEVIVVNSAGNWIFAKTGNFEEATTVFVEEANVDKVIVRLVAGGNINDWIRMTEIEILGYGVQAQRRALAYRTRGQIRRLMESKKL